MAFQLVDNKFGRKIIYTAVSEITKANVVEVLDKALLTHALNETNITYLEEYYTGNQPILQKTKTVRPEINNIIVENHAYEFVEFQVGQECGEPIQYVRRGKDESISDKVQKLNDYMASEDKSYWDIELSRWKHICGTAYRICYPDKTFNKDFDECPFGIDVLDPRHTFVVYSSGLGKKPMMGVHRIYDENNDAVYYCYTDKLVFIIKNGKIIDTAPNIAGMVLIVEYPNNSRRLSTIELVISIFDAINSIQSNRLDGIQQFVQAFMKFINCQIDETEFLKLIELGAIQVKTEPGMQADVDLVAKELNQEQTQVAKDDLYEHALVILGMPNKEGNTGGDTGAAVVYRNGWQFAEQRAEIGESIIKKCEYQFLRIALKILSTNEMLDLKISDIEIKMPRFKADNIIVKTQALMTQLQSGVDAHTAIKTCGLYSDPDDVYSKSKDVMEAKYGMGSLIKGQHTDKDGNIIPGGDVS